MAKIQYSKAEGGAFELIPVGTYDFLIKGAEQGVSKQKGTPQVTVDVEVVEGDYAGKTMKAWYYPTPEASWKLNNMTEVAGIPSTDSGQVDKNGKPILESDTDDFAGHYFQADVVHEEYPPNSGKHNAKLEKERASKFSTSAPTAQAGAAQAAASGAVAAPSAAGAPVQQRRPRPAPAS